MTFLLVSFFPYNIFIFFLILGLRMLNKNLMDYLFPLVT